ncbi:response regulator transcription factor [Limobrevibacterium gyesilva]|uniref:Response regulator transcription factor n=1 Tax=Limobrevibacterium gyesilva TaxID=2991712 RepID=A0AA42CID9_9PROT|nr:response regulator transcription factor [Limobrevibacterium gyesilva]MCW3475832.1 response regulator transcription factor [Limobrevibacterium gyesilva]
MQLEEFNQPQPAGLGLQPDPSVLLVEDDHDVAQTIRRFIERAGMKTSWARTGAEAVRLKESFRPDIVLVDLELPDMNGVSLISWLAARRDCGIIVVSGRGEEVERIVGIELGADDYVTKPVPMRELVARIRAVHRRTTRPAATAADAALVAPGQGAGPAPPSQIALGSARVDMKRRTVTGRDDEQIHLTAAEFVALEALIESAPQPVSRETLCRLALRRPFHAEDRGVDQLILNLRRKLFHDDNAHSVIVSIRGAGYAIATDKDLLAARVDNS